MDSFSNGQHDIPFRETRYTSGLQKFPALPSTFQQIGLLTPSNGSENKILPLYARRLQRDRWQYYAISNQHNDIKLPVKIGKKSALDDYGVSEQYSGDKVFVEGYNETFDVKLYETCLY